MLLSSSSLPPVQSMTPSGIPDINEIYLQQEGCRGAQHKGSKGTHAEASLHCSTDLFERNENNGVAPDCATGRYSAHSARWSVGGPDGGGHCTVREERGHEGFRIFWPQF